MRFLALLLLCLAISACGSEPAGTAPELRPSQQQSQQPSQAAQPAAQTREPDQDDQPAETTAAQDAPPPFDQLDWMDLPDDVALIAFDSRILDFEYAGRAEPWRILIAADGAQHRRGLMYWTGLPQRAAMLFVWPGGPVHGGFWNNNVPIDLSVAFLDRDGRIAEILYMDARSTDIARPAEPYWFALEVPRGRYAELGIAVGDRLIITDEVRALPGRTGRG